MSPFSPLSSLGSVLLPKENLAYSQAENPTKQTEVGGLGLEGAIFRFEAILPVKLRATQVRVELRLKLAVLGSELHLSVLRLMARV
jgi:hypothetical protein